MVLRGLYTVAIDDGEGLEMAEALWIREDEGTDRECMVAENGDNRVEVWYDTQDPNNPGYAYRWWVLCGSGWKERDSGALDAEDEVGACVEAQYMLGLAVESYLDDHPDARSTTAQQIASLLHDDGTCWETDDGRTFDALMADHGALRQERTIEGGDSPTYIRYQFDDNSGIVVANGHWWDLEGDRPWVCAGTGAELGSAPMRSRGR